MNNNAIKYAFFAVIGIVIGYFLSKQDQDVKVISTIETKTDTVFITVRDTVRITKTEIKHTYLRDTILINPIEPKIKAFTVSKPFLYGNVAVNGEVLGEVLKMDIYTDFNQMTITNTITKTNTLVKNSSGVYVGANFNSNLGIGISVDYLKNKTIFSYNNDLINKVHFIGVKKKIL